MSTPSSSPFDAVLEAARAGDSIAFEQLYRMLNRRVASFAAARRCPDPEGLVNEVFLRVFQNLRSFDGTQDQFIGWVFRITRNLLIDESRSRQRRVDEALRAEPSPTVSTEDVGSQVESNLETERLLHELDRLTSEQRDVVLLRIVADQSLESVADALGKSVGSIKSMQRRALRTLARDAEEFLPAAVSR